MFTPEPAAGGTRGERMSLDEATRGQISNLVESSSVFLFMKGNPDAPQCGFSAQVVAILSRLVPDFGSFDVLSDSSIRNGIKDYSEWPTIPQLYVSGEFIGGCDIIKEMYASGELHEALGLQKPAADTPDIVISEPAAELLRATQQQQAGHEFHLAIDATFEASLGFGPPQPDEVSVETGGVTLYMDRETAGRARGISIDAVASDDGPRLTIDNPNAPR
jgi:monothiol glutaredoxin